MNFINCDKELLTDRYKYLIDHMKGNPQLRVFRITDWGEPWGFGRENKAETNKLYREAIKSIFDDEVDNITDDEYCDYIIMALKTSNGEVGILWISEEDCMFRENIEDLFNALIIPKPSKPVNLGTAPTVKKPDNLVINKLNLFK